MIRAGRLAGAALGLALVAWPACAAPRAAAADLLIVNARIVDGSGAPAYDGAVRVRAGRIAEVGALQPLHEERVFDARGLVLAPGFIDTHSHHDGGLDREPQALAAVSQGITTIVVGQDGESELPLAAQFRQRGQQPAAVNFASYTGHGTLRARVLGEDYKRAATAAEIRAMGRLLAADLRAGSLGLSSGLEYDPGIYATREELIALARIAARHGARYASHMRSEDVGLDEAIDELIDIGRQASLPVHISHLKIALTDRWGEAPALLARLDAARAAGVRLSADAYPYEYWQADLTVLFPKRDFTDLAAAEFALTHLSTPEGMLIAEYGADPSLVGQSIAQIAQARGTSPAQTYLDLINEALRTGTAHGVIGKSMDMRDIASILLWDGTNVCSDGALSDRHPRGAGAFTGVLAWLVRDEGRLSLEAAVAKMTSLAADHVGIAGRGRVAPGMAADLVLFDPAIVADRATMTSPGELSVGIERVWVNGEAVFESGRPTGARPGVIVRRTGT